MIASAIIASILHLLPGYNLLPTIIWSVAFSFLLAWFSGVETGLYRLNRLRLHFSCKEGNKSALILEPLMKDQQGLIGTFLIGTNIFSYFITGFVTSYFTHSGCSEIRAEVLATLVLTPLLFVYTDAVPKNCFYGQPNRLMLKSARFIHISYWIVKVSGLSAIFNILSRLLIRLADKLGHSAETIDNWNHLSLLVKESFTSKALSQIQTSLAEKILELPERKLAEIIIPIWQVFALPANISREQFINEIKSNRHSFVPLYKQDKSELIGMVNSYQLLIDTSERPPAEFLQEMPKIRADERMMIAFEIMKTHNAQIANVVDNKGKTIGIVTLKDIIEEILKF